jgi:phage tail sheath protein FI
MPSALSYPGVYIEEVESGVRPITGVATSITAFIGRALRGPIDEPVTIFSYGEFERVFGGLWADAPLGYAVRDFYLNGGSQAIIVRLFNVSDKVEAAAAAVAAAAKTAAAGPLTGVAGAATGAVTGAAGSPERKAGEAVATAAGTAAGAVGATQLTVETAIDAARAKAVADFAPAFAQIDAGTLKLQAASPGAWANALRVRVDDDVVPAGSGLFNLSVYDGETGTVELFRNVSMDSTNARRVDKVLEKSALVRVRGGLPVPAAATPAPHPDPAPGEKLWDTNTPATNSKVGANVTDGDLVSDDQFTGPGLEGGKRGLYALDRADLFNLLCIPPHARGGTIEKELVDAALSYCERRRAMLIIDSPASWTSMAAALAGIDADVGPAHANGALYFPRLLQADPLRDGNEEVAAACGAIAGTIARTDTERGVWKAPAGLAATLSNAAKLQVPLTDLENGQLNMRGINCLRSMPPAGRVVWGARTREGDDRLASQWKYIPVRRTALFIEESLYRGTQWVVFEPNDEPLWASIRLNIGAFMQRLFRQGAFQGTSSRDAYFVKCDSETTTQSDIDLGVVNILVGFAPLKPAEFVVIRLSQIAGNIPT